MTSHQHTPNKATRAKIMSDKDSHHPKPDSEQAAEHAKRDHDVPKHAIHEVRHVHHAEKDALKHHPHTHSH